MKKYLAIYRACGSETESIKPFRPGWFNKLSCWNNFFAIFKEWFDIAVIWDGDKDNQLYSEIAKASLRGEISLRRINYKNNQQSLLECYKLADELSNEYKGFYFIEDDYLHKFNAAKVLIEGLARFNFVTLYDHMDRYLYPQNDTTFGQEYLSLTNSSHWRTVESTTCSVAMISPIFKIVKSLLIEYCNKGIGAPEDRSFYRFLVTNGLRLFSPIPGYSTHCVQGLLSPLVDWESLAN